LNIAVISHFGAGYSGGRIHAWFIVESLAMLGHEVTVYSDHRPSFLDDFSYLPGHDRIRMKTGAHFSFAMNELHDVLICIPDLAGHWPIFFKSIAYKRKFACKLVLVSYETPNWKREEQPMEYAVSEEYGIFEMSRHAEMVLANSRLSRDMAQQYFSESSADFEYLCPPIHTQIADSVPDPIKREKRVLIISRFTPRYKNSHRFVELLSESCNGYEFVFLENGLMANETLEIYKAACHRYGAKFRHAQSVTEKEKFDLIKSCMLTIYPSTFEGYGLPPVESIYCAVPCLAFDLPVLRQVHGNDLIYARKGDFDDFRDVLAKTLCNIEAHPVNRSALQCRPYLKTFSSGLSRLMEKLEVRN
jgi:hypothetical protein